jgi:hypothetical protein
MPKKNFILPLNISIGGQTHNIWIVTQNFQICSNFKKVILKWTRISN